MRICLQQREFIGTASAYMPSLETAARSLKVRADHLGESREVGAAVLVNDLLIIASLLKRRPSDHRRAA